MGAIIASNVTVLETFNQADKNGRHIQHVKRLKLVLSSQGGTANDIPMGVLGFDDIYSVVCYLAIISATARQVGVIVELDGEGILTIDPTEATDANRGLPGDITGDIYVIVKGRSV